MAQTASKLSIYGLGIVAANKPLDSNDIEVLSIEDAPMTDGEVTDNVAQTTSQGVDASGGSYQTSLQTTVSLLATWLPIGTSNRKTSPDVRRGEKVVLYQFADSDKYWWTTLEYDMKLRKLETVIFAISNTTDEAVDGTADSTYYFEISTHEQLVHLHTSKSNKEPFQYDIQLNTKDGSFLLTDDIGNFFSIDSANNRIELMNADGSHIDMDRKNINIYAPDSINLKADNNITLNAGNNITQDAGSNIESKAGSLMSDDAATITTKAESTTNTVPLITNTGNVATAGNTQTDGFSSGAGGGGFDVKGDGIFHDHVDVGSLTSQGDVIAPNIGN